MSIRRAGAEDALRGPGEQALRRSAHRGMQLLLGEQALLGEGPR